MRWTRADFETDVESIMYPHLTRQNPTLTNNPLAYDASKRHPAFGPSQTMVPAQYDQRTPPRPFDPSTSSPIFYGYVPIQSIQPMGPKL
ncbi:hypothetical protein BC941DRAFT_465169 [Chlamydoabsidia padenii]|nr:hypothetical protein BC941DRAFT_465169 [Chlamydoabsidia padenii]